MDRYGLNISQLFWPLIVLLAVVDVVRRPIKNKVLWIALIIIIPLFGLGGYLVYGRNQFTTPVLPPVGPVAIDPNNPQAMQNLQAINSTVMPVGTRPVTANNPVVKTVLAVIGGLMIAAGTVTVGFVILVMISIAQCQASGSSKCY